MKKPTNDKIKQNLNIVCKRIYRASKEVNRDPDQVKLLLATKSVDIERINTALDFGINLIGENKVQELKVKSPYLQTRNVKIHFIGHLQSNKIKEVIKWADCIESLDRLSLAEKLHKRLKNMGKTIDVLIQVNTSNEESKFGVRPHEAEDFIQRVAKFDTIRIKGLMTIGLFSSDKGKVRKCYRLLKSIQQKIISKNIKNVDMFELSMGMSRDLEVAIEEGATIVRVGTAIFGQREYPDNYYWNEKSIIN